MMQSFLLQDPVQSSNALDRILIDFEKGSGYQINKSKSAVMGINVANNIKESILQRAMLFGVN